MRAGQLRHRVRIQQRTESADSTTGALTPSWADITNPYMQASIEPLTGREYHDARAENSEVDTRIRMRYRTGIHTKMRVLFGSRTFDIQAVMSVHERGRELHLMCKEYTDGR